MVTSPHRLARVAVACVRGGDTQRSSPSAAKVAKQGAGKRKVGRRPASSVRVAGIPRNRKQRPAWNAFVAKGVCLILAVGTQVRELVIFVLK